MVLTSAVGTVLVNFFLRVNKPRFPMKVFRDEASARGRAHRPPVAARRAV